MTQLEEAKEFFADDVFATKTTGIEIEEVGECYAKCSMKIDKRHINAAGSVMGGAIFTLADFVFAVASNFRRPLTVTATSQISYLGPARGNILYGESKLLRDGKRMCFYEISITDNLGNSVATVSSSGMHIGRE